MQTVSTVSKGVLYFQQDFAKDFGVRRIRQERNSAGGKTTTC